MAEDTSDKITEDDVCMVQYFHHEKGDITKWCHWEKRRPVIQKHCPELIHAIDQAAISKRILNALVKNFDDILY